jgi:hypothetical protein
MKRIQQASVALSILSVVSGAFAKKDAVPGRVRRRTQEAGRRRHPKGVLLTYQKEPAALDNFNTRSIEFGPRNQTLPSMIKTKAKKKKEKSGDDKKSKSKSKTSTAPSDEGDDTDDLFVGVMPVWDTKPPLQWSSKCSGFYDVNDICHDLPDDRQCEKFDYLGNCLHNGTERTDDLENDKLPPKQGEFISPHPFSTPIAYPTYQNGKAGKGSWGKGNEDDGNEVPPELTDDFYASKPPSKSEGSFSMYPSQSPTRLGGKAGKGNAPDNGDGCKTYDYLGNCKDDIIPEDDVPPEPTDDYYANKPIETDPPSAPTISPVNISPTDPGTVPTMAPVMTEPAPTISPTISETSKTEAPTASPTSPPTISGINETGAPSKSPTTIGTSTSSPTMKDDDILGGSDDLFPRPPNESTRSPIPPPSTRPVSSLGPTPWPTESTDDAFLNEGNPTATARTGAALGEAPNVAVNTLGKNGKKNEIRG